MDDYHFTPPSTWCWMLRPEDATPDRIRMTLKYVRCSRLFVSVHSDLPLESTLSSLYEAAARFAPDLDLRVLIDKFPPKVAFAFRGRYDGDIWEEKRRGEGRFGKTVVAGCFDRLHNGHKAHRDLIQPAIVRLNAVREFLESVTDVPIDIRLITHPFLPALTTRDIQAMVVSEESKIQGQQFNIMRVYRNLDPLYVEVVDVLENMGGIKLSSTSRRRAMLGKLLRHPNKNEERTRIPRMLRSWKPRIWDKFTPPFQIRDVKHWFPTLSD
uniref:Cytidyltransferase-like domain-containing protein n=1 Tax=Pristionchus pacificus TaxID=54126 RepID=A0A8R1YC72_PRIPA